jgi:hypothetical protein
MHPEIKKFWEDIGYTIEPGDARIQAIYGQRKPNEFGIRKIEVLMFNNEYRFQTRWVSEEEMLKIIKLKAFI